MEQLFASDNAPFTISLAIMFLITVVEVVGLLFGLTISGMLDTMLPDLDLDLGGDVDIEGPGATGGLFTQALGWLSFGQVPALIWLVIFLTAFGLSGLAVQSLVRGLSGLYLPAYLAVAPALAVALPLTRISGRTMARILPTDESQAVSRDRFVGKVATIIRGVASRGSPAEAKLRDQFEQTHYVLVEPDLDGDTFEAAEEVLIVSQRANVFQVIAAGSPALTDD